MARKLHGAAAASHRRRLALRRLGIRSSRLTKRRLHRRKHPAHARPFGATAARLARRNVGRFMGY